MQNTNCSIIGSCSCPAPTPAPTSPPTHIIGGKIFNDINEDGKSVAVSPFPADPNYTGAIAISIDNFSYPYSLLGGDYYAFVPDGQHTITFSGLSQGFRFTYPNTPGNSLIVNVGYPLCSCPVTSEAFCAEGSGSCTGGGGRGSVINLNVGVTNNVSGWFQSIGSDMRWDSGFSNTLPSSKYASIPASGGMPGVIFSGKSAFGQPAQASAPPFNWQVGSFSNPEVFTDTHNLIPTSYRFLLETAQGSGIIPANITTLDNTVTHGIYKTNGDLILNGATYTFGPGNFIILVNGNLTIMGKIIVPVGSTAIFSAKGNITVNQSVGESVPSSTISDIEGLYSADNNFIADGNNNCATGADLRLNVAGTVIANAGRMGGTFVNKRTLCANNSSFPSVSFIERPDFMLNYPSLVRQIPRAWQNVAP